MRRSSTRERISGRSAKTSTSTSTMAAFIILISGLCCFNANAFQSSSLSFVSTNRWTQRNISENKNIQSYNLHSSRTFSSTRLWKSDESKSNAAEVVIDKDTDTSDEKTNISSKKSDSNKDTGTNSDDDASIAIDVVQKALQTKEREEEKIRQQQQKQKKQQQKEKDAAIAIKAKAAKEAKDASDAVQRALQNKEEQDRKAAAAAQAAANGSMKKDLKTVSARYVDDNGLVITTDSKGRVTARPAGLATAGNMDDDADANVKTRDVAEGKGEVDADADVDESSSIDMERQETKMEKGLKKTNNVKGRRNQKGKNVASTTDGKTAGNSNDVTSAKAKAAKMKKKKKPIKRSTIRGSGGDGNAVAVADEDTKDENEVSATVINKVSPSPKKKKTDRTDTNFMKKRKPTTSSISSAATMAAAAAAANSNKFLKENIPKPIVSGVGFNVVLTHCTADFDTLASAVGLAKLWSNAHPSLMGKNGGSNAAGKNGEGTTSDSSDTDGEGAESSSISTGFISSSMLPTFVVLPRGAHPAVQKFLALHKHLFPIRSLRSLPSDLSGLNRLGLVDAQRRDRVGPAEHLISYADRVTIIDHHIEGDSDIPEATDYVVDEVGSVSAMIAEQLKEAGFELSEAEATLLALGIHADTGSLCYDSTTVRDAQALAWVMAQGASQAAIAEHAHSTLSQEQQGVLTNALINTNSTIVHGVTVSTVLLSADGFINGLAAVTQDALELSSSDVYLLAVVYEPKSGSKKKKSGAKNSKDKKPDVRLHSKLLKSNEDNTARGKSSLMQAEAWKGGELALKMKRLRAAFDKKDTDGSGFLDSEEISVALVQSGVIASEESLKKLVQEMDLDGNGKIDFDEFVTFSDKAAEMQKEQEMLTGKKATTMIVIGRVKAGVNMKDVNLNTLFQQFGGGGHAKAASCTIKLADESDAGDTLQGLVDELIETSLMQQSTVGDFMTSPVLSAKPAMNEKQVEDLFIRYDVRALPVVDDNNDVIGLVTYKEVAAAKQRLWNKEQKRIRQEEAAAKRNASGKDGKNKKQNEQRKINQQQRESRKLGSALKGWMKQHVQTVEAGRTMAEVEAVLLENDVGCIPVVADGTTQLVGLVTRTDLLRQHRYYPTLHYHNPGFADSIAARKPIIELRKKLKQFDLEEE